MAAIMKMDFIDNIFSSRTATTFVLGLLLPAAYLLLSRSVTAYRRHRFAKSRGCLSPVRHNQLNRLPFGVAFRKDIFKAIKQQQVPQWFDDTFHNVGQTWECRDLFSRIICTSDPLVVKAMLGSTQFNDFGVAPGRYASSYPFLGDGVFNSDGKVWKNARSVLTPLFGRAQINEFHTQEIHMERLLKRIYTDPTDEDGFIELFKLFGRYSLDCNTEFALGMSTNSLLDEGDATSGLEMSLEGAIATVEAGLQTRGDLGNKLAWFFMDYKKWYKAISICHTTVDKYIDAAITQQSNGATSKDESEKAGPQKYLLLQELAKETQDRKFLRDSAINILHAGKDSVGGLLSWIIRLLARREDIFTKLRKEVVSKFGEGRNARIPDYNGIQSLNYLQWVVKEVLRLYPLVPLNDRNVLKDTTIPTGGGLDGKSPMFLKKGESVIWSVYTIQRSKEAYGPDADKFVPERWSEEATPNLKEINWWYIPFNRGARSCPGQYYAINQVLYALVRLLQNTMKLELKPTEMKAVLEDPDDLKFKNDLHLTMGRDDGLWIKFTGLAQI